MPAESNAKGIVVVVVESLSGFLEYIGSFWFGETLGDTCSLLWIEIWLIWSEFDKSVVEEEHAMEVKVLFSSFWVSLGLTSSENDKLVVENF